jgi:hypothetical protein
MWVLSYLENDSPSLTDLSLEEKERGTKSP